MQAHESNNRATYQYLPPWKNAALHDLRDSCMYRLKGNFPTVLTGDKSSYSSSTAVSTFFNPWHRRLFSSISILFVICFIIVVATRVASKSLYARDTAKTLSAIKKRQSKGNDCGEKEISGPISGNNTPPTVPYSIPFVAHGLDLIRGSRVIARVLLKYMNVPGPLRFQIFGSSLYYVSDPTAITQIWREARYFSFIEMKSILLERSFGVPARLIARYRLDDSGTSGVPRAGSLVAPRDRYLSIEAAMLRQLLGPQSKARLSAGYVRGVVERANQLRGQIQAGSACREQGSEEILRGLANGGDGGWLEMPCLWLFLRDLAFSSSLDSFCGPDLLRFIPSFLDDFWLLDENITKLSRKLPRWLIPNIYRARDTCRAGIQVWREHVLDKTEGLASKCQDSKEEMEYTDEGEGVHWGVRMTEIRDEAYDQLNLMDSEARAAFDLALIWASHSNPVAATFWVIYEVLSSPTLYSRCLAELNRLPLSSLDSNDPTEAVIALSASPLLQAIFAETLRLYVTTTNLRRLQHQDAKINGLHIPQGSRVLYSAHAQHMNPTLWTRHDDGPATQFPSVDEFCPDRFLVATVSKTVEDDGDQSGSGSTGYHGDGLFFSLDGLAGTYLPFGGGPSMCPGRDYAKDQALTTLAVLLKGFEFDIQGSQRGIKADSNRYGAGTLVPERKKGVSFRVRERKIYQ